MNADQGERTGDWTAPQLVELDLDMTDVEAGNQAGTDGSGGVNTSLAS